MCAGGRTGCVHACMHLAICACMYTCLYLYTHTYTHVCMCVCMDERTLTLRGTAMEPTNFQSLSVRLAAVFACVCVTGESLVEVCYV